MAVVGAARGEPAVKMVETIGRHPANAAHGSGAGGRPVW